MGALARSGLSLWTAPMAALRDLAVIQSPRVKVRCEWVGCLAMLPFPPNYQGILADALDTAAAEYETSVSCP
jgi:hypothetical protein